MANANNAFGFEVLQTEGKENRTRKYVKTTGTALYPGDAVKLISAGTVSIAAAGDQIAGICAEYQPSASAEVNVYDDPDMEFFAQCSADFAAADVGQNANIVANAADTTLKQSNHTIDSASFTTNTATQFKLLGLLVKGENAVGSYAIVRVRPNNHLFKAGVSGV